MSNSKRREARTRRSACALFAAASVTWCACGVASAATSSWTGPGGTTLVPVGGNWNDAAHWSDGELPASADDTVLSFGGNGAGATAYTAHNDIPGVFSLRTLYLDSNATGGTHHLSGNPLRLVSWLGINGTPQPVLQNLRGTWNIANDLELVGEIRTSSQPIANVGLTLSGVLSGSGSIVANSTPELTLTGANVHTGMTIAGRRMTITGGGRSGYGGVEVRASALLSIDSADNLRADGQVNVLAGGAVRFGTLDAAAIQRISPLSAGVLAVGADSSADLDLTGRPDLSIGTYHPVQYGTPGPTYTLSGAITPAGQAWRFGGTYFNDNLGITEIEQSTLKVASPLNNDGATVRSVRIGSGGTNFSPMRVTIANPANSYSGGTVIERGGAVMLDWSPAAGETPLGGGPVEVNGTLLLNGPAGGIGAMSNSITIGGSVRFNNATADIYTASQHWPDERAIPLNGGAVVMHGNAPTALSEKVGAISAGGGNNVLLLDASAPVGSSVLSDNELHFDSLSRIGRATVQAHTWEANSFGTVNRFKVADASGLVANGMVGPWVVGVPGQSTISTPGEFLRVDGDGVFQPVSYTAADPLRDDEIVDGGLGSFGSTVWAVRVRGINAHANEGITIRSGGIILHNGFASASGAGFVFANNGAPVEGVVYVSGDNTLSGGIHGSAGLTVFGSGSLSLVSSSFTDFTGGLTINQGTVRLQHSGALNAANPNALVVNEAGTLDLYQTSVTVSGLDGNGTVTNTQGGTLSTYTLTVNATTDQTFAGALRNQSGRGRLGLTKAGPAALTLTGTYGYHGLTTVSQGTLNADFAISEPYLQDRDFSIATGATLNVGGQLFAGNIDGDGTMTVNTGGVATARRVRQDELAVTGTGLLAMMEGIPTRPADVSRARELSVAPTARLNLNNNALIVDYDAGPDSPLAEIADLVALGRGAGGAWDGPGISSGSAGKSGGLTALAVAEAADVLGLAGGQTGMFWHQIVDASAVLVHYTYGGDATMDGKIDIDDYGQIDFNVSSSGSVFGWFNGDFNYDGKINIDDYGIIDFNVGQQTGTYPGASDAAAATPPVARRLDAVTAVPEPNVAILAVVGASIALRRRRDRISPSREG